MGLIGIRERGLGKSKEKIKYYKSIVITSTYGQTV
jgi:hypothetical protein